MKILMVRSTLSDMGPGTQPLVIAREMQSREHQVSFVTSGGVYVETVVKAGFRVHIVEGLAPDKHDFASVLLTIINLRRIIRDEKPDVIHGHNAAATILAVLAGYTIGRIIPSVTSVRGVEERKSHQWRNKIWLCTPGVLLAVCENTLERLVGFGVNERKIHVTFNGVDLKKFTRLNVDRETIRSELGLESSIVVGTVGAMTAASEAGGGPGKGQHILVQALSHLRQKHPELKVLLVGDGPDRHLVEALTDELGLQSRVKFVGRRFDIPEMLSAMDIYCLASVHGEFFPNSIVEAMAMELPWVGSDIAGLKELTANGEAGWVSEIGDVSALAENLDNLASDSALRLSRGLRGKEEVLQNLTIEKVCDRILYSYEMAGVK